MDVALKLVLVALAAMPLRPTFTFFFLKSGPDLPKKALTLRLAFCFGILLLRS